MDGQLYTRMDGLVKMAQIKRFRLISKRIRKDLKNEGFDDIEINEFLRENCR